MGISWRVWIDFDEDGYDDGDEITSFVENVRVARGRERGEARYLIGTAEVRLQNTDRRFFYWNESGPYYGYLEPGKPVRIAAKYDGTEYDIFNGYIEDMVPAGRYEVLLRAHDVLGRVRDVSVGGEMILEQSTGAVAATYMERAGITAGQREVDDGATTVHYAFVSGKFGDVIRDLVEAERGRVYVNQLGKVVFEDRHRRLQPEYQDAVMTLDGNLYGDVSVPVGWQWQVGRVCVTAHQVQVADTESVLFHILQPIEIPGQTTVEVWGSYQDAQGKPCGGADVQSPVAHTDYEANAQKDGGGVDRTDDLNVTMSAFASNVKLTLTNNGDSVLYVTTLQVRGKVVLEGKTTACTGSGKMKSISPHLLQDFEVARSMAAFVLSQYQSPSVHDAVVRLSGDLVPDVLGFDVSTRLHVENGWYGVDTDFFVEGLRWDANARREQTVVELTLSEAVNTGGFWILGYSALNETTKLAY